MGPGLVVVGGVSLEHPAQVRLAEHDDMVERFAADRADRSLDMSVPPRLESSDRTIADTHCTRTANGNRALAPSDSSASLLSSSVFGWNYQFATHTRVKVAKAPSQSAAPFALTLRAK
jgi:hypothetical protein